MCKRICAFWSWVLSSSSLCSSRGDILYVLGASKEYEIIEHDLEMSEVVVPNVSLSQAQEAMASPFTFLEQQHSIVSELKTKLLSLEKSIVNSRIQESHQTTIDSYFGH